MSVNAAETPMMKIRDYLDISFSLKSSHKGIISTKSVTTLVGI